MPESRINTGFQGVTSVLLSVYVVSNTCKMPEKLVFMRVSGHFLVLLTKQICSIWSRTDYEKQVKNMTRKEELLQIFDQVEDTKGIIAPLIDDVVFLEAQLQELRKLPFIRINPVDHSQQKATPAAKQYKELLQQYNNCIKILTGILRKDAPEEESPLRQFI